MTKEKLIQTIKRLLSADLDLSFLMKLTEAERATLVASIRERVDRATHDSGKAQASPLPRGRNGQGFDAGRRQGHECQDTG